MSWEVMDEINSSIREKIRNFNSSNQYVECPDSTKGHLDIIKAETRKHNETIKHAKAQADLHQSGGFFLHIQVPGNMPAETQAMREIGKRQKKRHDDLIVKRAESEKLREEVKKGKKAKEKEIRILCDGLKQGFEKRKAQTQ